MTDVAMPSPPRASLWVRFWHEPVRGERLALLRILLAAALLADQLILYFPNLAEFFGPEGVAPAWLFEADNLHEWRLTALFFSTDNMVIIQIAFGIWVGVTLGMLLGWKTRLMTVLVWLMTRCFHERFSDLTYGADSVLSCVLFLLMLAPSGAALSLDAWRQRRRGLLQGSAWVAPWSLRLLQIQHCLIYFAAGLWKFQGDNWGSGFWDGKTPSGSWWDGTALHYFFNDLTMGRWSYGELPIPIWITRPLTYLTVCFELAFPLLVLFRWTRGFALTFAFLMHIGIAVTVDIGWFSYYTLALFALWTPNSFWERFDGASVISNERRGLSIR